jgi:hypothetical protein
MRKAQSMMLIYAMLISGGNQIRGSSYLQRNYESEERKQKRLQEEEIRLNIKRGLKPFEYGDRIIWAINKKVADKKAKRTK